MGLLIQPLGVDQQHGIISITAKYHPLYNADQTTQPSYNHQVMHMFNYAVGDVVLPRNIAAAGRANMHAVSAVTGMQGLPRLLIGAVKTHLTADSE